MSYRYSPYHYCSPCSPAPCPPAPCPPPVPSVTVTVGPPTGEPPCGSLPFAYDASAEDLYIYVAGSGWVLVSPGA